MGCEHINLLRSWSGNRGYEKYKKVDGEYVSVGRKDKGNDSQFVSCLDCGEEYQGYI